jgi:hypothetical protein
MLRDTGGIGKKQGGRLESAKSGRECQGEGLHIVSTATRTMNRGANRGQV